MKRVWKPLDVADGLRLYKARISYPSKNDTYIREHEDFIVAAKSPTHAKILIEDIYKGCNLNPGTTFSAMALDVYIPEKWWRDGMHCPDDCPCRKKSI